MKLLSIAALVLVLAGNAHAFGERQPRAMQMREDYGLEPGANCYMNYYYYIPCPTSSWFWAFSFDQPGEIVGAFYTVGDPSMGRPNSCPPYKTCDPCQTMTLAGFRVLDFAGYGTAYPGLFTVRFDVWCCSEHGCPIGSPLWTSGPTELCESGWNYIDIGSGLPIYECTVMEFPHCYPRFLITATAVGSVSTYPAWGFDNISIPAGNQCAMHDEGCCPALYPRPFVSHYDRFHSGYYGLNFEYCPALAMIDPQDTSLGTVYGCLELAWRAYFNAYGATEPTTWGNIKSLYR